MLFMKLLFLITASLWLLSCKKEHTETAQRLFRTEELTNNGTIYVTEYGYDAQGRIITIKKGSNNNPVQPFITVTYNGNEATLQFQPATDSVSTTTRQIRLTLDAGGKLLRRVFFGQQVDLLHPNYYEAGTDTMDCSYDAAGFLKTVSVRRSDSFWRPPSTSISGRRTFINQYTTADGKLTNIDQSGLDTHILNDGSNMYINTRTLEYQWILSYSKLQPNKYDCSNAAILNQTIGGSEGSSQYYYFNLYDPMVDAQYRYMPDRTQIHGREVEGNGNVAIDFTGVVEVNRTYNASGMLATTETISPNPSTKRIRYFYGR